MHCLMYGYCPLTYLEQKRTERKLISECNHNDLHDEHHRLDQSSDILSQQSDGESAMKKKMRRIQNERDGVIGGQTRIDRESVWHTQRILTFLASA